MRNKTITVLFLILFFSSLHGYGKELIFRGFKLTSPPHNIQKTKISEVLSLLKKRGYYRNVNFKELKDKIVITVSEFPLVKKVIISGLTIFSEEFIKERLNLYRGKQFNRLKFVNGLKELYRISSRKGFTHFSLKKINIKDNGVVYILISEGVVDSVYEKNGKINNDTINFFFSNVINKPFNDIEVKKDLEKLLYTGAFFELKSKIVQKGDKVFIEIDADKKRVRNLSIISEYSKYKGVNFLNEMEFVKRRSTIGYSRVKFHFNSGNEQRIAELSVRKTGFKRDLSRSGISCFYGITDLKVSGREDLIMTFVPDYYFRIYKKLGVSFFIRTGLTSSLDGNSNVLFANPGISFKYFYESQMRDVIFKIDLIHERSIDMKRSKTFFYGIFKKDSDTYRFIAESALSKFSGSGSDLDFKNYPDNNYQGILTPRELSENNLSYFFIGLDSGFGGMFFKPGVFFQYIFSKTDINKKIYGANFLINLSGVPLNLKIFIQNKRLNLLLRLILSI